MPRSSCCSSRFGTAFDAKIWLALDPCGLCCASLSLSVHVFALLVLGTRLISPHSSFAQLVYYAIYCPIAFLALWSLYMAWSTDPGGVPLGARPLTLLRRSSSTASNNNGEIATLPKPQQRAIRRCHKCNDNFKPPRAHHDSVTGRCIVKFDHFCPWVGNAIGAFNHKFFVLFIGYTLCASLLSLFLIFVRLIQCGYSEPSSDSSEEATSTTGNTYQYNNSHPQSNSRDDIDSDESVADQDRVIFRFLDETTNECDGVYNDNLMVILLVVSVLFMFFTCCMLMEQIEAIQTNTGKIARMQMKVGKGGTELQRVTKDFNEMFGGNSPDVALHWFIPLPVKFPKGMRTVVVGYDYDKEWKGSIFKEPDEEADSDKNSTQQQQAKVNKLSISAANINLGKSIMESSDDLGAESDGGPLVAQAGDPVKLGSSHSRSKQKGVKKRGTLKVGDDPVFVDRTKSFS
mmetsp:Transcript_832/g.1318  ORF Transcript_832/g.1318 Transcript_832/m.1318 type:complete len:459 (+) Transcript_832:101-1477(+)|eukprot:CAMPEP_0195281064 /NCGR_PEP_ID=MMETSP0707-20130614/530_1 /TAXON_ID=33640 /ORGANISM="Asterionellopsis glacialis, Strain CCMP134" /LENGTH=458 /DNA_ID=CAMNT_0040339909 /DNA_START=98 /DNA_END=1474 /DNA_ORIENTATION=+